MLKRFILSGICLLSLPFSVDAARIIPHQDLTYLGAFKLSNATNANKCLQWSYIDANLTFNPAGDGGNGSLIVTGYGGCARVAEVSIPTPTISGTITGLPEATVLQALTDVGNDDLADDVGFNTLNRGMGDALVVNTNQLAYVVHESYTVDLITYEEMLAKINLDFTSSVGFAGWFQMSDDGGTTEVNTAEYQHYIFAIPSAWQSSFGGKEAIVGSNRQNSGGSYGATMWAVDIWGETPPASGTDLTAKALVSYDTTANMNKYFHSGTPSDMVWAEVGTKSAVVATMLCPGRDRLYTESSTNDWTQHAYGWYYGNPHPEAIGGKGYHAEPYSYCLSFYDPDDLAEAYAGTKDPHTVQPYAFYTIQNRFYNTLNGSEVKLSSGIAYDPTGHKLYVAEKSASAGSGRPVIHVFSVADTGSTLDSTAPSNPSNLVLSNESETNVTLTWDASTDATTNVRYQIWVNGYPAIITSGTTYNYTYIDEWAVGDASVENGWPAVTDFTFKVSAIDDYYNESNFSNEVTYGESGGPISECRISGEIH